ncbi:MAG: right-handed parallel beta-helix repeat-containing protein [Verrucomicrobia bacterium]|nr:right-handed parallel beta-helix repeat-containing protein [Verrucomicrobiota bacterium]
MNPVASFPVSRREWLERMSGPALVAALAAGADLAGAQPVATPAAVGEDRLRGARIYNVHEFGAKGDGAALDTAAVQAAIDACTAAGGGTVLVPAGDFVVGTLELKSNVTLHLAAQGRLLGSDKPADYHAGRGIPTSNGNIVLLGAADAENITLEGPGTIDGNGLKFWTGQGDNTGPGQGGVGGYFHRPHLLVFARCKNVRMRDVFLTASAYHCCRILNCERVWFDGVRIYNRVNKNNDGFHFNSCQYVHVRGCDVKCQDDACALFGSNKWVTVDNCTFSTRWAIFRFGSGECENITVSNCVIYDTYGCAIKMGAGGRSRHQNISFSNLILRNVTGPITLGFQSGGGRGGTAGVSATKATKETSEPPPEPGFVRNISFSHIRAHVVADGRQFPDMHWAQVYRPGEQRTCITLNGVGEAFLENISLSDVHVTYEGGGTAEEAALRDVPQVAGEYFQIGPRPAYGLYARNVRGLTLHNVRLEVQQPDLRPAVIFDHVSDASVNGLAVQGNPAAESVLRVIDSREVLVTGPRVLTPAAVFLRAEGKGNAAITIDGGDIAKARRPVELANGAGADAVRVRA